MKTLSFDMTAIDYSLFAANMRDCCVDNEETIDEEYEEFKAFQARNEFDRGAGNIGTTVEVIWVTRRAKPRFAYSSFEIEG